MSCERKKRHFIAASLNLPCSVVRVPSTEGDAGSQRETPTESEESDESFFQIQMEIHGLHNSLQQAVEKMKLKSEDEHLIHWVGLLTERRSFQHDTGIEQETYSSKDCTTREAVTQNTNFNIVDLDSELLDSYFHGFCLSSIWPLFHYFIPYTKFNSTWWEAYQTANHEFRRVIIQCVENILDLDDQEQKEDDEISDECEVEGGILLPNLESKDESPSEWESDEEVSELNKRYVKRRHRLEIVIWIHDYHLLLLPLLVKQVLPDISVCFFLHTPCPSSDVFRVHPNAADLLKGMLGADVLAFHIYSYLRHFRFTALRVLGCDTDMAHVDYKKHRTHMRVFPIGANARAITNIMECPSFENHARRYMSQFAGKHLVLSVERLDLSKGLLLKLSAIKLLLKQLESNPSETIKIQDIVFLIIAPPLNMTKQDNHEYVSLQKEVHYSIAELNGLFSDCSGSVPIVFVNRAVEIDEIVALYARADVCLLTPLSDGMNLVSKELLIAKDPTSAFVRPGILILSEFAGSVQELFNALIVNPYNSKEVAEAIHVSLHLSATEKWHNVLPMRQRLVENDGATWACDVLQEVDNVARKINLLSCDSRATKKMPLELASLFKASNPGYKLLFLDYDGTLREFCKVPSDAVPSEEMKRLFEDLASRPDLLVCIISGRDQSFLQTHFSQYGFYLVAEHGYYVKYPNSDWNVWNRAVTNTWKEHVREMLHLFVRQVPGAFCEEKISSLVWHYRNAEAEFGEFMARGLLQDLEGSCASLPVEISHGQKIVEVSSVLVKKGLVVQDILQQVEYQIEHEKRSLNLDEEDEEVAKSQTLQDLTFSRIELPENRDEMLQIAAVLIAGDDRTDESMFSMAPKNAITCKVNLGQKETSATYTIETPHELRRFLKACLY